MSQGSTYQPTAFDFMMLDILTEQVEKKAKSNYEQWQLEKYGNILHEDISELDDEVSLTEMEKQLERVERFSEQSLNEA